MSSRLGGLMRRAAVAACLTLAASGTCAAQEPLAAPPAGGAFLPRFDGTLLAAALAHDDPRFSWDMRGLGDIDLFSYRGGRATILAEYQSLLGNEFQPFDPYQSNYRLEAAGSWFLGPTEIAGVLHHESRHLGDRPKDGMVAQNSLGPRIMRRFAAGPTTIDARLDVRKVIARSYVDYTWMNEADLVVRRRLNARASVFARGYAEFIAVDPEVAGRNDQNGGRVETGVRLDGAQGRVEIFTGFEQMIDADPLDRVTRRWAYVGLRLLTR